MSDHEPDWNRYDPEDAEDCIHGLGPKAACVICNGTIAAKPREEPERIFKARFEGQCSECNLPIAVGQLIAWRPGGQPRHESCTGD